MTVLRRALLALTATVAVGVACAPRVVSACDQYSCRPQLASVTPLQVVLNGKPVHLTITGYDLVNQVLFAPVVPLQGFSVFNDTTLLVTLPADTPPGIYSVRVVSPDGASDPSMSPRFQVFPAPPPSQAPTPTPRATPTPVPTPTPMPPVPDTGVIIPTAARNSGPPPPPAISAGGGGSAAQSTAPLAIMIGLALGAVLYLLWGSPRRLSGSWRTAPMEHLVGRPLQALHLGKICLYCGRLHFVWRTRRDLWKEGRYCGPHCFISAEALPSPLADEDEPEPVMEHKRAAWWRAAVATDQGPLGLDTGGADPRDRSGWRPRF
jgi:hypothetical protein